MIYIDKIKDRLKIIEYLWSLLLKSMDKKEDQII